MFSALYLSDGGFRWSELPHEDAYGFYRVAPSVRGWRFYPIETDERRGDRYSVFSAIAGASGDSARLRYRLWGSHGGGGWSYEIDAPLVVDASARPESMRAAYQDCQDDLDGRAERKRGANIQSMLDDLADLRRQASALLAAADRLDLQIRRMLDEMP